MYTRKSKEIEEVAAMEATAEEEEEAGGVRTTRAAKLKKRKLIGGELSFQYSSLVQLKHHRRVTSTAENSTYTAASDSSSDPLSSHSSDHILTSCSSNCNSSQLAKQNFKITDLQEKEANRVEIDKTATSDIESSGTERRKTTTSRDFQAESAAELESAAAARPSEANSRSRSTAAKVMPSDTELEEFFSTAEKDLHKQFADKYNFDIVKEEPLEGRYEWVQVKQY